MTAPAFDTVIVPDFRSPDRVGRFEPQTLLFLASWMEHAGAARHWPVHVACIGEPPQSIRMLAEQCGALVSVHDSPDAGVGSFSNKLRAWDVDRQTDQLLYLDADMLCLGDPSGLAAFAGCAGGLPAGLPRVPEQYWRIIDDALQLPAPTQRMPCCFTSVGIPLVGTRYGSENEFGRAMWPLYNGGLFLVPFDAPLPDLWVRHWKRIEQLFPQDDPKWEDVVHCDMTALATALRTLEAEHGIALRTLPDEYNTRWMHMVGGAIDVADVRLFHAVNLFRQPVDTPQAIARGLARYDAALRARTRGWALRVARHRGALLRALRMWRRGSTQRVLLLTELNRLLDRYARPVIEPNAGPS